MSKAPKTKNYSADTFKDKEYFMDMHENRWKLKNLTDVSIFTDTEYYARLQFGGRVRINESVYFQLKAYLDSKSIM